jgi:hypothetical protein
MFLIILWYIAKSRFGCDSSDNENDKNSGNGEGSGRNSCKREVGQIMGTDSEGTMFDNGRTGNGSDCGRYLI